jgi:hypothetical protein
MKLEKNHFSLHYALRCTVLAEISFGENYVEQNFRPYGRLKHGNTAPKGELPTLSFNLTTTTTSTDHRRNHQDTPHKSLWKLRIYSVTIPLDLQSTGIAIGVQKTALSSSKNRR